MKRRWWFAEIIIGVYLAVSVFAIGYSVSSAGYPKPSPDPNQQHQSYFEGVATALAGVWEWATEDATSLFTIVLTIATIAMAASTHALWRETTRAGDLAREEFIATHRPRVIVRRVQGPIDDGATGKQTVFVTVVNIGETHAIIEHFGGEILDDSDWSLRPSGEHTLMPLDRDVVLNGGEAHIFHIEAALGTVRRANVALSRDQVVSGALIYRDGNKIARETSFRRRYSRERQRFIRIDNSEDEYAD